MTEIKVISIPDFAKKYNVDATLVRHLIEHYGIKPDTKYRSAKLFREERLKEIVEILNKAMAEIIT